MPDSSIINATAQNCVIEQNDGYSHSLTAMAHLDDGLPGLAVYHQLAAQRCHEEMRMRLDRLIGVS